MDGMIANKYVVRCKMNRRGEGQSYELGKIVLILIGLAVIMSVVYVLFVKSAEEAGSKSQCELSILLGSIARFGGVERVSPECKANVVNIAQNDIDKQKLLARQELNNLAEKKNNPDYAEVNKFFNNPSDDEQLTELITNKIIAKEMTSCWDKVVHGKLGMFDEWYNLFDLGPGLRKGDYEKNRQEYAKNLIAHWEIPGVLQSWGPPKFCIVCSDITFGNDLKNKNVDSFTSWLKATPHWYYKDQSLYEFLVRDQNYENEPYYDYEISPGKQYAVVFERVNMHQFSQWYYDVKNALPFVGGGEIPEDKINRLVLKEYDKVVKPFDEDGQACYRIID